VLYFVAWQAIRDGVIEATIDHEQGYVQSKEMSDIYGTKEPMTAFHQRITFCLEMHNNSVKVTTTCLHVDVLCTGFRHPGTYPKNPVGFFGYTHLKNPPQKTHTSTLTTNNAIFYCFLKLLSNFSLYFICH